MMREQQMQYQRIREEYVAGSLCNPDDRWPADVQRALKCINRNLFDFGFSVQDMRDHCHIHQGNFSARFRYFTGRTPSQYIKKHRVACAKAMLTKIAAANSVYGIALEVGYEYPSTFSSAFKKETGLTPVGFRKSLTLEKYND